MLLWKKVGDEYHLLLYVPLPVLSCVLSMKYFRHLQWNLLIMNPRSGKIKDCENGICCFSTKETTVRSMREVIIMWLRGVTCLLVDCCFNEKTL